MNTEHNYLKAAVEALTAQNGGTVPALRAGDVAKVGDNWQWVATHALKLARADAEQERTQVAAAVEYVVGLAPLPANRPTEQQAREVVSAIAQQLGSSQGIGAMLRLGHVPTFEHEHWYRLAVEATERALLEPAVLFYPMTTAPLDGTTVLLEVEPDVVLAGHWDAEFGLVNLGEEFGFASVGAWTDGSMASVSYQEYNSFTNPLRWAPMPAVRAGRVAAPPFTEATRWPARTGWLSREKLPEELPDDVLVRAYAPGPTEYVEDVPMREERQVSASVFRAQPDIYSHWLPAAA